MSVYDVEDRIEHALWRNAWQAHDLYGAFGARKKDGQPLTAEDFYGREIAAIREHMSGPAQMSDEARAKFERAQAAIFEAQMRRDHPERIEGDPVPPEPEA